jgi:hypothetical protein
VGAASKRGQRAASGIRLSGTKGFGNEKEL